MGLFSRFFNRKSRRKVVGKSETPGKGKSMAMPETPEQIQAKQQDLINDAVIKVKAIMKDLPDRARLDAMIPRETPRTFVFGDVHGDLKSLAENLYAAGLINKQGEWIGKEGDKVVFLGDYIDRGSDSLQCYEWIKNLKTQAKYCRHSN